MLASWVKRYLDGENKLLESLIDAKYKPATQLSFVVLNKIHLDPGKDSCGLRELSNLGTYGLSEMGTKLNFGRIPGLEPPHFQCNFGSCTLFAMRA